MSIRADELCSVLLKNGLSTIESTVVFARKQVVSSRRTLREKFTGWRPEILCRSLRQRTHSDFPLFPFQYLEERIRGRSSRLSRQCKTSWNPCSKRSRRRSIVSSRRFCKSTAGQRGRGLSLDKWFQGSASDLQRMGKSSATSDRHPVRQCRFHSSRPRHLRTHQATLQHVPPK